MDSWLRFGHKEAGSGTSVVVLPETLTRKTQIFDSLEKSLSFPYFGRNWDALRDCLSDLEWLDVETVVIRHPSVRGLEANDLVTYVDVLRDAAESDLQSGRPPYLVAEFLEADRTLIEGVVANLHKYVGRARADDGLTR